MIKIKKISPRTAFSDIIIGWKNKMLKIIGRKPKHSFGYCVISFAAKICYQAQVPRFGKKTLNVLDRLFSKAHHTTHEHINYTFSIEGISVGDITFGLHLANPFYNTDQRSGRFCSTMFASPDIPALLNYIGIYWPNLDNNSLDKITNYLTTTLKFYSNNLEKATEISARFIKEDRVYASDKYVKMNAAKIAQEQLRNFIPIIFPTGLVFTANLITLASMYRGTWSPVMRDVLQKMADIIIKDNPDLNFLFEKEKQKTRDHSPVILNDDGDVLTKPKLELLRIDDDKNFVMPEHKDTFPVDLLHFIPETMDNNTLSAKTLVEISIATMGQDQRHRTIRRSEPAFTGNFYLPPILKEMELEKEAKKVMTIWIELSKILPQSLATVLAPYGAMVRYEKEGSLNAIAHEQAKRECFCAQEEIYHLSRLFRLAVIEEKGENSPLLEIFKPICALSGICGEGARYCGRDIKLKDSGEYYPERKI